MGGRFYEKKKTVGGGCTKYYSKKGGDLGKKIQFFKISTHPPPIINELSLMGKYSTSESFLSLPENSNCTANEQSVCLFCGKINKKNNQAIRTN